jgi:hypothetical protein
MSKYQFREDKDNKYLSCCREVEEFDVKSQRYEFVSSLFSTLVLLVVLKELGITR